MSADTQSINGLDINTGPSVSTSTHLLIVNALGTTGVTNIIGWNAKIIVDSGGTDGRLFNTDLIDINSGGLLDMASSTSQIDIDLDIFSGRTLAGNGVLLVMGSRANKLSNSGTIHATGGTGTLVISSSGDGAFTLNGSNGGVLEAVSLNSTLVINTHAPRCVQRHRERWRQ